jgi:hypothetical protein
VIESFNGLFGLNFLIKSLVRWKKWKLDNEKIERLTKVAMNIEKNEILKFFEEKLDKFRFFARGKRGILFAGERKEDQLPVVVKLSAENGNPMTIKPIDIEAKWISILNRVGEFYDANH